jgi:ribosome-associated protein
VKSRDEAPSRTRRKHQAESLQTLGERLAKLPPEVLDRLGLPERLRDALAELNRISSHEAQRRQRQFIGRLMREVDAEPLQAAIEEHDRPNREAARRFRATERWRDRLLAEGAPATQAFLAMHPSADGEVLAATLAAASEGQGGAMRRLFRLLKEEVDAAELPGGGLVE